MARTTFVISDLHLGGPYREGWKGQVGSRLNSRPQRLEEFAENVVLPAGAHEIVVNGDSVDFLAAELRPWAERLSYFTEGERASNDPLHAPFIDDEEVAVEVLEALLHEEDRRALHALGAVARRGGYLTFLIGNHDLELKFPEVRRALRKVIGGPHGHVRFRTDGKPHHLGGRCIAVHGNETDQFNNVDYVRLHQRVLHAHAAAAMRVGEPPEFFAPAGSHLVAATMNRIKRTRPFIDLLKPETSLAIPLLLFMAPEQRSNLTDVARHALASFGVRLGGPRRNVSRGAAVHDVPTDDPLEGLLICGLGTFTETCAADPMADTRQDVSRLRTARTWISLLTADADRPPWERDLGPLRAILQTLVGDPTFDPGTETDEKLKAKCKEHAERHNADTVIVGHTHLAKVAPLGDGRIYINTGTWADVLQLSGWMATASDDSLRRMIQLLATQEPPENGSDPLSGYLAPTGHYARVDIESDRSSRITPDRLPG